MKGKGRKKEKHCRFASSRKRLGNDHREKQKCLSEKGMHMGSRTKKKGEGTGREEGKRKEETVSE